MTANKSSKLVRAGKYPVQVAKQVAQLPSTNRELREKTKDLEQHFLDINHQAYTLRNDFGELKKFVLDRQELLESIDQRLKLLDERVTDALHQVTILSEKVANLSTGEGKSAKGGSTAPVTGGEQLIADEHLLDNFYVQFERWFRGTEAEIAKRQSVYLPYFTQTKLDSKKFPVIDIGCGNGEFVELLHEKGLRAIGLDLNKSMIDHVKEKGLEGVQGDALSYLRQQKANSLMAITGFHIVEHIPFLDLVRIFNECYRVLAPGGFVLFETPNPENIIVGSCNFYNDPSHLHPLPPAFLELVMKTRGFPKTEIKRLHPLKPKIAHQDPLVKEMAERFFGPQDYAIIAHK